MRRWWAVGAVIALIGIVGVASVLLFQKSDVTTVSFDNYDVVVRVVDDEAERTKGLSGSGPLDDDEGMLFVFPVEDRYGFWMKDMNYPIDIIWLDSQKRIVDIKAGAEPSTYPEVFSPGENARYVVELKAGMVGENRLRIGQYAQF